MYVLIILQTVSIGIKRLLCIGTLLSGVMTATFGCIHFIPHSNTTMYTLAGFGIRTVQAVGTAAIFTTVFTLITERFPEHNTLMLVGDDIVITHCRKILFRYCLDLFFIKLFVNSNYIHPTCHGAISKIFGAAYSDK